MLLHNFILNWLYYFFGVSGTGPHYGFWSGAGSDITELGILGGLISIYRKNTCEVHSCFRLGKHKTEAGHAVCRVHHPHDRLTADKVVDAHNAATERRDS